MGSENLFHRQKAKKIEDLARKKARREGYAKVLIVCEGEKTEPNYFNGLKDHLALNSANIIITGDCGSDPMSVVDYVLRQYRIARETGDPFDKVFCVFDKDTHTSYDQAIEKLESAKPKNTFYPIASVPCFEYWLLLHFTYSTRPYQLSSSRSRSGCELLISELHGYFPGYQKGDESIFDKLVGRLPQAKAYAIKALNEAEKNNTDNPSTHIHKLVEFLENIKR